MVELKHQGYTAQFIPEKGMNFVSLKKGDVEAIDQSTYELFETRRAGLGAMIGPHFHHRNPSVIPKLADPSKFPFTRPGTDEPFSHGIGRYAPWTVVSQDEKHLSAELKGSDQWQGVSLKDLEGQDFKMTYQAQLVDEGLQIELSVVSDTESVVGLHTYYALADGQGVVRSHVQESYNDMGTFKPIPSTWNYSNNELVFDLKEPADYGFLPSPDFSHGAVLMETASHQLRVQYWSENEENSWQLWHPNGSSFVCIEPLSARNPRGCRLSVSRIKILISIL